MTRLVFRLLFLILVINTTAQDKQVFSGGMMFHSGYLTFKNSKDTYQSTATGIGGRLHYYLNSRISAGFIGGNTHFNYENNSFFKFGHGGLHIQYQTGNNKIKICPGILAGYGIMKNYHITKAPFVSDQINIYYYQTFLFSPTLSFEYFVTDVISLMLMSDYITGNEIGENKSFKSPRLYVGILFNR